MLEGRDLHRLEEEAMTLDVDVEIALGKLAAEIKDEIVALDPEARELSFLRLSLRELAIDPEIPSAFRDWAIETMEVAASLRCR